MEQRLIDANRLKEVFRRDVLYDYSDIIDAQPTVEERKTGKWIYHEKSKSTGFKNLRECSCCHCYFKWEMPRNSFCPNCGADMREVDNE